MKTNVQAAEVTEVFRAALRGEIVVKLLDRESWLDILNGDVEFMFGDWRVVIYNDVLEVDYVEEVTAPDGRRAVYEEWAGETGHGADPIDLLTHDEGSALTALIMALTPEAT